MSSALALLGGPLVRTEPYPEHTTIVDDAEERAVLPVLRQGHLSGFSARPGSRFLGGEQVRALETECAQRFGVKHAVTFNSATSALHGAVAACGVGPGDEVVTSPYTMCATASSVLMQNAIPIFADIEDRTFGLDPAAVEARISQRTRAVIAVNLFGHPARLDELREITDRRGVPLIEDNAQAPGASYQGRLAGTIGRIGVLSLNYHKAGQTGEGGVALTDDDEAALRLQLIRNHGEVVVGEIGMADLENQLGWNYRLSEIHAAIGRAQLPKLDRMNEIRVRLARRLSERLAGYDFLVPPREEPGCTHGYYLYPMRYLAEQLGISRDLFVRALQAEGVSVAGGYIKPIYLNPMYQRRLVYGRSGCPFTCGHYDGTPDYEPGACPVTERLYREEMLTTDICKYPNGESEVDEFVAAVAKVADGAGELAKV